MKNSDKSMEEMEAIFAAQEAAHEKRMAAIYRDIIKNSLDTLRKFKAICNSEFKGISRALKDMEEQALRHLSKKFEIRVHLMFNLMHLQFNREAMRNKGITKPLLP